MIFLDPQSNLSFGPINKKKMRMFLNASKSFLPKKNIILAVNHVSKENIQMLNKNFRQKDYPTNILSFCYENTEQTLSGEIFICLDIVKIQAISENKKLKNHYIHLLVHGLLHIMGHDHEEDDQASVMENIEIKWLKSFSYPNPY